MRKLAGILLSVFLLAGLVSCGGDAAVSPTPDVSPTPEAAVSFVLPRTGSTMHPILGSDRINLALAPLIWEGLFELDNTFTPRSVLCERGTVSSDGLTWTFTLRSGITFSDGSPLTAAEAAQSLQLAMHSSRYAARLAQVKAIRAADAHTLTVSLASPNGSLPALLDIPIVKGESEEPVGTGPYVIMGSGDDEQLVRRADWWRDKDIPLGTIPLRTVSGPDDLIYAFDTYDVSLVTTDLTGTNALGFSTGYEAWDCPTTTMIFLGFNAAKGACTDPTVRRALSRALDRASIAGALFIRHAEPAVLPISPVSPLYDGILAAELDYSFQAAADLFSQAGYTLSDGVLKNGRQQLSLALIVNNENSFKTAAADYLAQDLGRLGVRVEVRKLAWSDYEKALGAGDFDLYLGETMLTADFNPTGLVSKGGSLNFGKYDGSGVGELLSAFLSSSGDARADAASELCRKLGEDAPFAVLCFKNASVLTHWGMVTGLAPTQNNAFSACKAGRSPARNDVFFPAGTVKIQLTNLRSLDILFFALF
jgi:peptide/nickel transport system substrate-binding protein